MRLLQIQNHTLMTDIRTNLHGEWSTTDLRSPIDLHAFDDLTPLIFGVWKTKNKLVSVFLQLFNQSALALLHKHTILYLRRPQYSANSVIFPRIGSYCAAQILDVAPQR